MAVEEPDKDLVVLTVVDLVGRILTRYPGVQISVRYGGKDRCTPISLEYEVRGVRKFVSLDNRQQRVALKHQPQRI